ncbi:MAG: ATP-binding cassette domain-containing protein [Clostridia bacterium]|nr:ATP-binding cassette domain-containing protein [Clostridia bacterium]
METFKIEALTFRYPQSVYYALSDISFTVTEGEFVTLCGKSGSGKSTLLRQLIPSVAPYGERSGSIYFNGQVSCENIGFVPQNPENGIVTDKVWHELAFGLENMGLDTPQIRARVAEMASFFGIQTWFHKSTSELSGGQKQLLNLASAMVIQPSALVLDEPTSQLDPIAAQEFLAALKKVNRELGVTVILSEHRLEEAFSISDRIIVLDGGRIFADGRPSEICKCLRGHDMFDAMPAAARVYGALCDEDKYPVTIREGRKWLDTYAKTHIYDINLIKKTADAVHNEPPAVELRDIYFRYEKNLDDVLNGLNLKVYAGEIYAVMGGNGTGKTTALNIISGINKPYRGKVLIDGVRAESIGNLYNGCIGAVPQDPKLMFLKKTVRADLYEIFSGRKMSSEEKDCSVNEVVELCGLEDLLERHPYDLSGGEQQKLAIAKILLQKPKILLLDEPTKGMDAHFKAKFAQILINLKLSGTAVIMVSHDIEFCAEYADRCAMLFDGIVASEGTAREFFAGKSFYTTSANRISRGILPNMVLAEDIIRVFGKEIPKKELKKAEPNIKTRAIEKTAGVKTEKKNVSKRTVIAALTTLIAVPITIFAGFHFLNDRKYYFISLLIILETLLPFIAAFEHKKPQPRELVIISVLCAVGVAGRAAFYMLPQFKPVAAVVIITGVCFGCETGFFVGVVTAFVSNFFFGQGPWTPWQMFALGIVGFAAGVLFYRRILPRTRLAMCIFGFVAVIALHGAVLNVSSVLMYQAEPNLQMILSSMAMGLPFDLIYALSTAFFLFAAAMPMIEKLGRVKDKYGIGRMP